MICNKRAREYEYCRAPWYSSRETVLLTTKIRWAWMRGCSSSLLLGDCSWTWRKMMSHLVYWRMRIKTFRLEASLMWRRMEGWGLLKTISNNVRGRGWDIISSALGDCRGRRVPQKVTDLGRVVFTTIENMFHGFSSSQRRHLGSSTISDV